GIRARDGSKMPRPVNLFIRVPEDIQHRSIGKRVTQRFLKRDPTGGHGFSLDAFEDGFPFRGDFHRFIGGKCPCPPGPRPLSSAHATALQTRVHLRASSPPDNTLRPGVHTLPKATTERDSRQSVLIPRLPG